MNWVFVLPGPARASRPTSRSRRRPRPRVAPAAGGHRRDLQRRAAEPRLLPRAARRDRLRSGPHPGVHRIARTVVRGLSTEDYEVSKRIAAAPTCIVSRHPTFDVKLRNMLARDPLPDLLVITNKCGKSGSASGFLVPAPVICPVQTGQRRGEGEKGSLLQFDGAHPEINPAAAPRSVAHAAPGAPVRRTGEHAHRRQDDGRDCRRDEEIRGQAVGPPREEQDEAVAGDDATAELTPGTGEHAAEHAPWGRAEGECGSRFRGCDAPRRRP